MPPSVQPPPFLPAAALCLTLVSPHPSPNSGTRRLGKQVRASLDSEAQGYRWWQLNTAPVTSITISNSYGDIQEHQFQNETLQEIANLIANSDPERVLIEIWRLSFHHLYRHDAKRPDVHLWPVRFPGHNFGGHPVRRAYHGAAFALLWGDLGAEAEVSCGRVEESPVYSFRTFNKRKQKQQYAIQTDVQCVLLLTEFN